MDAESASDAESLDSTCPFLARSTASGLPLCLAHGDDVIGISSRYVAAYCLTTRHVECSRFIHAEQAVEDRRVGHPRVDETVHAERAPGGGSLDATGDKPPTIGEAPPEATGARSPTVSEPVGQIQPTPSIPRSVEKTRPLRMEELVPTITSPASGTHSESNSLTLAGTARPHSRIRLLDWMTPLATLLADADGRWSCSMHSIPAGDHLYKVEALDAEGNVMGSSKPCAVTIGEVAAADLAQSGRAAIQRRGEPEESPELAPHTGARLDPLRTAVPVLPTLDARLALLAAGAFLVIAALVLVLLSQRSSGSHPHVAVVGGQRGTSSQSTPKPASVLPTPHLAAAPTATLLSTPRPTAAPILIPASGPTPTVRPAVVPRPKPAASPTATPQPTTTSRPSPTATPRPKVTATPVKRSQPATTPVLPAPAIAWHFPALHQSADKVILTLANPTNGAANVQVRIMGKTATTVKRVLIPAASGTEMDLSTPAAFSSLSVVATAPIVPQRLVIRHNTVRSFRGQPGA